MMNLIDQIKADREAGTPGPWAYEAHGDTMQYGVGVCHAISDIEMAFPLSGQVDSDVMVTDPVCVEVNGQTNARRIARVPDMEAALLAAADHLVAALEAVLAGYPDQDISHEDYRVKVAHFAEDALTAFRKAIGECK